MNTVRLPNLTYVQRTDVEQSTTQSVEECIPTVTVGTRGKLSVHLQSRPGSIRSSMLPDCNLPTI